MPIYQRLVALVAELRGHPSCPATGRSIGHRSWINALEARMWLEDLTGAVAKTSAAGASMSATTVAADAPDRTTAKRRHPSLLVLAVVAIASGVVLDLKPASANNSEFDAIDLAPIGCYALGLALAARWAF